MKYTIDKTYPTPNVEKENVEYAKILMQDYAGENSELSAILNYSYQTFEKLNTSFSDILEIINQTEMKHLELLGKTIKLLGLNPEYVIYTSDNKKISYNLEYLNYNTNIINMLKKNIEHEKLAIFTYTCHMKIIEDKYIKKLLKRIIEDEELHVKIFYELINNIK